MECIILSTSTLTGNILHKNVCSKICGLPSASPSGADHAGYSHVLCLWFSEKNMFSQGAKKRKKEERERDSDSYLDSIWLLKLSPKDVVPAQKAIRNLDWTVDAVFPLISKAFKTCCYRS
jgi:hypothetical protein